MQYRARYLWQWPLHQHWRWIQMWMLFWLSVLKWQETLHRFVLLSCYFSFCETYKWQLYICAYCSFDNAANVFYEHIHCLLALLLYSTTTRSFRLLFAHTDWFVKLVMFRTHNKTCQRLSSVDVRQMFARATATQRCLVVDAFHRTPVLWQPRRLSAAAPVVWRGDRTARNVQRSELVGGAIVTKLAKNVYEWTVLWALLNSVLFFPNAAVHMAWLALGLSTW
jgi:hypothetical protein